MKLRLFYVIMFVCFGWITSEANTDITQYDNIVYIDDVTAKAGDEVTLSVKLKNKDVVYAYEFKLELPIGAAVVTTTDKFGYTEIESSMTEVRTNSKRHTFNTSLQNGVLTVLCYSIDKKSFSNNDGEVAQIKIKVSDTMAAGSYPIKIKDEAISLETSTPIVSLVESSLTITNDVAGDVNGDNNVNILDIIAIISHLNGATPANFNKAAADIDNSGTITKADVTTLAKKIIGK